MSKQATTHAQPPSIPQAATMLVDNLRQTLAELEVLLNGNLAKDIRLVQELERRRKSVQWELDSVVYPVLTLPNEITSEIFSRSIPFGRPLKPSPSDSPLVLLRVCRAWREVALSTPILWATLDLDISNAMSANLGKCVQSWISRARSLPLSLRLVGSTRPECDHVFSILRQHAQRLQHLALALDWDNLSNSSDVGLFPLLGTLILGHVREQLGQPILRSRAFDGAEQLRSVDILFGVIPGMFALPWAQLTRFLVSSLTVKECVQILRDCPLLKECCFHRINLIRDLHAGPLLRHSSLEDLTIEPAVGALIVALDLPTLCITPLRLALVREANTLPSLPYSHCGLTAHILLD